MPFYPYPPLKIQKSKLWKMKFAGDPSFYTCVPKVTITWCTVPDIRSKADRIFLPFWVIFCPFTSPRDTSVPKLMIRWCTVSVWDMVRNSWNYFTVLTIFCRFTSRPSPTAEKIKLLKKWKNCLEIRNYDQMCGSWDMVRNGRTDGWKVTYRGGHPT